MTVATESLHNLTDLERWTFAGTALAVVGQPVAHSLSPIMHNAALAALAEKQPRFQDWRYFKFDIAPAELPRALALFHGHKFHGLNLTVPHKSLVIEHLVASDDFVRAAGAANTLTTSAKGWTGENTDGAGLSAALKQEFGVELRDVTVVLLGAGGAARAAVAECLRVGCKSIWVGNRTPSTLAAFLAGFQSLAGDAALQGFDPANPPSGIPPSTVVINATSLGLKPEDAAPLDLTKISRAAYVYDMIYRPARTALLRQAEVLKIPRANGLSMLVHQGARSLASWTGALVPVQIMQDAVSAALQRD